MNALYAFQEGSTCRENLSFSLQVIITLVTRSTSRFILSSKQLFNLPSSQKEVPNLVVPLKPDPSCLWSPNWWRDPRNVFDAAKALLSTYRPHGKLHCHIFTCNSSTTHRRSSTAAGNFRAAADLVWMMAPLHALEYQILHPYGNLRFLRDRRSPSLTTLIALLADPRIVALASG